MRTTAGDYCRGVDVGRTRDAGRRLGIRWQRRRGADRSRGFTLVELLVVITIIGMLMAMIFPATGAVLEMARQAACKANLKQISTAIKSYESQHKGYPPGLPSCVRPERRFITGGLEAGAWCQGPNWATSILSFAGEGNLAKGVDACMKSSDTSDLCTNVCQSAQKERWGGVGKNTPNWLSCPSAPPTTMGRLGGGDESWGLQNLSKGNYAACFGAGSYEDATFKENDSKERRAAKKLLQGAFGVVAATNRAGIDVLSAKGPSDMVLQGPFKAGYGMGIKTSQLTDGDQYTIMVSEVVGYESPNDARGVWTNTSMGASVFTAKTPPNADGSKKNEYYDRTQICDEQIGDGDVYHLKCFKVRDARKEVWAAARSGHGDGVIVMYCDSHADFVANTIEPSVWQARATIAGNESGPK